MSSPNSDGTRTPTGYSVTPNQYTQSNLSIGINSSGGNTGSTSGGISRNAFQHQPPQTYANRAASAIKASGLAQRFGKAIYGSSAASSASAGSTPSKILEPKVEKQMGELEFQARSGILAMGMSHDKTQAAIAGKDFFEILDVDKEIKVSKDLRQSRETRDFDKMFAVTALKWGHQLYNHHVALATSGGNMLLYNLQYPSAKDAVTEYSDNNRCINTLAFSPNNGHILLSGTNDGSVKVWDLRASNKKPSLSFYKGGDSAREVQCSPHNSTKFAVIYDSGMIQRWDFRNTKACDKRMSAHTSVGLSIDWHPYHDYIVSGGRDKLIQVWNMSKETRDADVVILAPSAVSKVRWQVDNAQSTQARNASSAVLNTCIASSVRSKYDFGTYIWNPRRPFIPVNVLEYHTDTVSEIQWRSDKMLWTASRDKYFTQHDLSDEPLYVDNITSAAFAWSPQNDVTFLVQDKYRNQFGSLYSYRLDDDFSLLGEDAGATNVGGDRSSSSRRTTSAGAAAVGSGSLSGGQNTTRRPGSSSYKIQNRPIHDVDFNQAVCFASFAGFEPEVFRYFAEHYTVIPSNNESLPQLCEHNSKIARSCGKLRTAQTWMILKESMEWEVERYKEYLESQGANNVNFSTRKKPSSVSAITQTPNNRTMSSSTGLLKPFAFSIAEDRPGSDFSAPDSHKHPSHHRHRQLSAANISSPSTPLPISTGVELDDDDEQEDSDNSTVQPISVPDESKSQQSEQQPKSSLANEIVSNSVDTNEGPVHGSSYESIIGTSPEDYRSSRRSTEKSDEVIRGLGTSMSTENWKSSLDGPAGLGISSLHTPSSHSMSETARYQEFLRALNHPWTTSNFIKKVTEFAMEQGDVQLCAVLGVLFIKFYPEAFPSTQTVEEWVLCYVELLKRCEMFTAAAEVIKSSNFNSVKGLGLTETQLDTLCHRCNGSLSEINSGGSGYWFCDNCKKLLDGCIICREPVKGLASALIDCGHKVHVACMKEWLFDEEMLECPSGCGAVIVT